MNEKKTNFLISLQGEPLQKSLIFMSMSTLTSNDDNVDWDKFWKELHKKQAKVAKVKNIFRKIEINSNLNK